ncbi:MAG: GxxExxY protein [Planctomycetes bacterium]|nr:GxxExxY protein [Planctomycetota bacterium]
MKTTERTEYTEDKYPYSELTGKIIKCAIDVHKTLGPGFTENIYEKALICELKHTGLDVKNQVLISVIYKDMVVGEHRLDLLVEGEVIVENKAVRDFDDIHKAQVLSYLKATGKRLGLLLNFAKTKLEIQRIVL